MEKLSLRSDGYYETPSGLFAIAPRKSSGKVDGLCWFEFKTNVLGETIRLEWPEAAPVIAIDQTTALSMLRHNYAKLPTQEQADAYNAAVDAYNANPPPPPIPDAPPPPPPPENKTAGKGNKQAK